MADRINLHHIERQWRAHAEPLALAYSEIRDALVPAQNLAGHGYKLARRLWSSLALLLKVGRDEGLVVASGNEANLLRVRLLGQREAVGAGHLSDFRLGQAAEWKHRP